MLEQVRSLSISAHVSALACGWAGLAILDLVAGGGRDPAALFWASGVGLLAGALTGGAIGLVASALLRLPNWASAAVWAAVAAAVALWLEADLGVLARLGGDHHLRAVVALLGCVVGGVAIGGLGWLIEPRRRWPRGWLVGQSLWARRVAVGGLGLLVVVATFVDRSVEPDDYPSAHVLLRWVSVVAIYGAALILLGFGSFGLPRLRRLAAIGGVWALSTALTLDAGAGRALAQLSTRPYTSLAIDVARLVGDVDFDGHSPLLGGGDCAPFDGDVHPMASEVPDNGVDENCRGGDGHGRLVAADRNVRIPERPSPRSIVLVTIDTVSATRLSLYDGPNDTWPEISSWAQDGLVFDNAFTSGGWTSLAISSMFRGLYPRRLEWTRLFETSRRRLLRGPVDAQLRDGERTKLQFMLPLEDRRPPLPWWLARRGMHTAAIVDDGESEFLDPQFMSTGFDTYLDLDTKRRGRLSIDDADVTDIAIAELARLPEDRPFFLWVHYYGPHRASRERSDVPDFGSSVAERYDEGLRFTDGEVARFLHAIDELASRRELAVVLTSDHGERLNERDGRGHGRTLHDQTIRVPLILYGSGVVPGRTPAVVSTVDVMPTILALTETPGPSGDGEDVRSLAAESPPRERIVVSETWRFNGAGAVTHDLVGVVNGKDKLVLDKRQQAEWFESNVEMTNGVVERRGPEEAPATLRTALARYLDESGEISQHD